MSQFEIVHGDSLIALRELQDNSFDGIITDPPYCSGGRTAAERSKSPAEKYVHGGTKIVRADFSGDTRDQRGYFAWCSLWLAECLRVAKDGSPIVVFSDWRQVPVTTDALQAGGWTWRGIAVWDKTASARPQRGRYTAQAEFAIWGSKGAMPFDRNVGTLPGVFSHRVRQEDKFHLTGKPTRLMADVIKIVAPGGHILDPFCGSGTTGVAAVEAGYSFTGIEQLAENVDISHQRITETLAGKA